MITNELIAALGTMLIHRTSLAKIESYITELVQFN